MALYAKPLFAISVLAISALALTGCETLSYYSQSVSGQLDVLIKRRPIAEVVADPAVAQSVRTKLGTVAQMRRFAVTQLKLPDNKSYTQYSDLKRDHVVWNVFATPALSVDPVSWCFPIVGCVVYRGYFSEADAKQYATKLANEGFDTHVGGINAYSTLGWFSDPVLNTFMFYSDARLAGLLFHEITHQKIYIKGDSVFNESLATAVELEGIRRWLERNGEISDEAMSAVRQRLERSQQVTRVMLDTREALARVYASQASDEQKLASKTEAFDHMQRNYLALKTSWDGYAGYDRWFDRDFNNAHLVSAAAYHSRLPAFERLIEQSAGDMEHFWQDVEELAQLDPDARTARLDLLMHRD